MSTKQVRASHILIKHQGSRRKASWKDPEGRVISNTTRESAVSQLKALRDDILSGKSKFDDIASRYSDCSSAKRGGDLDKFACSSVCDVDPPGSPAVKENLACDIQLPDAFCTLLQLLSTF